MSGETNRLTPPAQSAAEAIAVAAACGGLASIPLVGGLLSESLNHAVAHQARAKVDRFMQSVVDRLESLQADIDDLRSNEAFVASAMQASIAAATSASELVTEGLRNNLVALADSADPVGAKHRRHFLRLLSELDDDDLGLLSFS